MLNEDFLGRIAIVCIMTVLAVLSAIPLLAYFHQNGSANSLAVVNQVLATVISALQVFLTVGRLPPKGTAQGIEPRITSVAGTFLIIVAMFVTPALESEAAQMVALCMIFIGMVGSVFCLYWLGRSSPLWLRPGSWLPLAHIPLFAIRFTYARRHLFSE